MKKIELPESWQTDEWYGFTRHHFVFEGRKAWIVEPQYAAGDGRWSWCTVWPEAYVERVGIVTLLEHGFYHVHIDVYEYRANPECIGIMRRFQEKLEEMGLSAKANLIGMSWGGYFSLRYAEENPEKIAAIYLDAPVCNAADPVLLTDMAHKDRQDAICRQYGMTFEELTTSKLNPLNNVEALVNAKIPMFAAIGMADITVHVETNFDLLEARIKALGGCITVLRRNFWGHHPHGLDKTEDLLKFHCEAIQAF